MSSPTQEQPPEKTQPVSNDIPQQEEISLTESPTPALVPAKKSSRWKDNLLDFTLSAMLISLLVGTGFHLNKEITRYHIPSPLELASQENEKLVAKIIELETETFNADKRIRLVISEEKLRKTHAETVLTKLQKKKSIESLYQSIIAEQDRIREADTSARRIAREQLLPGIPIATITNKRGQVYNNCVIYRIENKHVSLRHSTGQSRIPLSQFPKKDLPTLIRYALDELDLVNTQDFDSANSLRNNNSISELPRKTPKENFKRESVSVLNHYSSSISTNFDPRPGSPTLDSKSATPNSSPQKRQTNNFDEWHAPDDAPLPI